MTRDSFYISVQLNNLIADPKFQAREGMDMDHVEELKEFFLTGNLVVNPVDVFQIDNKYYVVDGFHRVAGARAAGCETIPCRIFIGPEAEAIEFAAQANIGHGLKRSNADKKRSVLMLLRIPIWRKRSDRMIADHCGVSDKFVASVREESGANESHLREGRDGKTYQKKPKQEQSESGANESHLNESSQPEPPVNDFVVETTPAVDDAEAMMEQTGLKPIKDLLGQLVTLHAREAFEHGQQIEHKCRAIAQAVNDLVALKTRKSPIQAIDYDAIKNKTTTMLGNIRLALPGVLCPKCKGEHSQCSHCDGKGWHSRLICKAGSSQFEDLFGFKYGEVK